MTNKTRHTEIAREIARLIRIDMARWQCALIAERADESSPRWLASSENEISTSGIAGVLSDLQIETPDKKAILYNAAKFAQFCKTLTPQLRTRRYYTSGTVSSAIVDIECAVSEEAFVLMQELYEVYRACDDETTQLEIQEILAPTGYINRVEDLKRRVFDPLLVREDKKWCLVVTSDDVSRFLATLED